DVLEVPERAFAMRREPTCQRRWPPHARGLDLRWQTNGSVLTRRCTEVPTSRTNEPGSRRSTSPQPAAQFLSCSRSGHGRLACAWKFDFAASRGSGNPNRFTIDCNVVRLLRELHG